MSRDGERREDSNVGSLEVVNSEGEGNVDRSYLPPLSDEIAHMILARVPLSEQGNLGILNKRYLDLARSGDLYGIRREIGVQEPLVFLYIGDGPKWWAVDPRSGRFRALPPLPADFCFQMADKETFSVWTHFLVTGRMLEGMVTWRYELHTNQWFLGPSMITRRCLFASAKCGDFVCVAGGIRVVNDLLTFAREDKNSRLLNSAERYSPRTKSWDPLPAMNRRRRLCSGVYMDDKFYVIGGVDENDNGLRCGEFYDLEKNTWELVPDMLSSSQPSSGSPPLLAVANNDLYLVDSSTNEFKVYLKETKSWMVLGDLPVRADTSSGWGVAFKSLGNELLLIGTQHHQEMRGRLVIFTCRPQPGDVLHWQHVEAHGDHWTTFIYQCSTMLA